ncbi:MAG: hypothetical protein ACE10A_14335 [Acidiferrobacterales bacterium]|nr:hypothetical protein [Gammaproteobacteria bacterium]MCZ6576322.1 hypothetical protein [Gammaproteobacteria bacterium]
MNRLVALTLVTIFAFGSSDVSIAQEITVVVKGSSWDADSRGFASIAGLSKKQGTVKAARRGSRVSVDGLPDRFAIAGEGGEFELTFKTSQPTFRLIVDGDRFPRTITQPFTIPKGGGEFDVGRVNSPRAEGAEHTWPLPMVATALGYATTYEMLADDKAAIRLLVYGSGAEGAPKWPENVKLTFPGAAAGSSTPEPTTTSPFLMRIRQSEYVIPFDMNKQDTYFYEPTGPNTGAFIIVVSFKPGEAPDKGVIIQITDTVTDKLLDPPRPWHFDPKTVSVRNGFATDVRYEPDIE